MYGLFLKALEIQGFKSFPDKTVLTFGEDITAIVGPNGSGKSNLSDAVRWVMGEQSTRALRGGKMEDVIFGGTVKRRQLGFAEVSLVLDNADRALALDEDEVMVTRRYYRSGESEYYINRRTVRLKDVNELFMDTGLGREGYSIIGQGKIDEILSVKSADRREIFEEAAGISRYRHRKEEAERRLERTEENLLRIGDKIDELELQVEPLRQQAEKAKRFLICRDEMRGLEVSLWLEQLDKLRAVSVKTAADCDAAIRQREEVRNAQEAMYAAAEGYAVQMREKEIEAERVRQEMARRQEEASQLERAIAVLHTNVANNRENARRLQGEMDRQAERDGSLTAQIAERSARLQEIVRERTAVKEEIAGREKAHRQAAEEAGVLTEALEALRRRAEEERASAAEEKALLSALAAAAQELMDRDATLRWDIGEGENQLQGARDDERKAETALEQAKEDRDSLTNVIQGYTLRLQSREKKERESADRRMKLQMEANGLQTRIHMLAEMEKVYEGYSKAVKLVMGEAERGRLRGVRGPVAGLLQVPDLYTVAIETALGGAMQHLVVEREEDGKSAILWLKRREGGRATFLPMDAIRPADFRDRGVEGEPGFVGMGDALITFDPAYSRIFSNLLGRTVIADQMDSAIVMARKYGHRFRIVTLDGQVLNPGGSMTGGSSSRSAGILSRANELAHLRTQAEEVERRLGQAVREAEQTAREANAARYELETAREKQRERESEISTLEERRGNLSRRRAELEEGQRQRRGELEKLVERAAQTERDTERVRARIEALEGSVAAFQAEAQGKEAGQSAVRAKTAALEEEMAQLKLRLTALEAEEQISAQSVAELETLRQDLAGDRAHRASLLADCAEQEAALQEEIGRQEKDLSAIRRENQGREETITRLGEEKLALEGKRNQADRESREKNTQLLQLEREVSFLEQKRAANAQEEKGILDRLWERYELTHEAAQAQRLPLESVPQAQRRVAELKKTISGLGNINLDAIEEFERVNERYTYLTDQRDDVRKSKGELAGIITQLTEEMKRIFAEQFKALNTAFGQTFRELFGGGRAALELEDPEDILNCGIEIRVQPPGKTLKILTLLSGGEKAFVAIALYFAILKVRPTPFCVMDEIEAALDDANVVRYARYMRSMASSTQFIVITHRRGTMEEADVLYGVTMQEEGVSRILTINLNDVQEELGIS
ncbi:chromosome segregation protein SMC [Pseudoflavonifractor phocaeensis]|uniref:chromosome segregation protein SMC n=1 Tax=Pseudoflavonifractor phocaeensis TaxID=1870988 RepID=UPI001959CAB5|nr:chromosome segregation protein SMC [Pseudoflavonifractor phocaeensis]